MKTSCISISLDRQTWCLPPLTWQRGVKLTCTVKGTVTCTSEQHGVPATCSPRIFPTSTIYLSHYRSHFLCVPSLSTLHTTLQVSISSLSYGTRESFPYSPIIATIQYYFIIFCILIFRNHNYICYVKFSWKFSPVVISLSLSVFKFLRLHVVTLIK